MYLGSMAIPSNLMETQGIVPPPPTHSLAASRLNVARRMLRRAEGVLSQLENPSRGTDQPSSEEPQEEVTPIFEARVIVPSNSLNEPIDEVISAVHDSLLNATPVPLSGAQNGAIADNNAEADNFSEEGAAAAVASGAASASINVEMDTPPLHSASSTPEGASPASVSVEDLAVEQRNNGGGTNGDAASAERPAAEGANGHTLAENASRTSEMADLLDTLLRLQIRLAPFLEQYQTFMRQDPSTPAVDVRKTQAMINRVSEILHFLGHAYHSLSDIIVRVRTPPPRPLLCRPILIQHSAVVQTGFPIQVEAEINISQDSMPSNNTSTTQQTSTNTTNTATAPTANTAGNAGPTFTAHIPPQMLGLLPTSVHVQSFPIEIRGIHRSNIGGGPPRDAPANTTAQPSSNNASTETPAAQAAAASSPSDQEDAATPVTTASSSGVPFNNPNLEFFMEVTPESITIDSLEATLLGSNQGGDVLRGAMNGPPPEFLQSIIQMAGQIINRTTNQTSATTTAQATTSAPTSAPNADSSSQSTQSSVPNNAPNAGQNSQARGNTQTQPTTSTHTRSTARPHVHLAQHAMQGFDPFLPCNSHHVTPRRRIQARNVQPQSNQNNNARPDAQLPPQAVQLHPVYNIVQGIVNSFRNAYRQRTTQQNAQPAATPPPTAGANANATTTDSPASPPPSETTPSAPVVMPMPFLPHLQNMNISDIAGPHGPTLSQLMEQFSDDNYVEGESIFTDLIMLLSRNLTIADLIRLNNGQLEPLMRMRSNIRNFFLERVLDGNTSTAAVDRGVNRFMVEMQPLLENLENLTVRDDIDIIRSTQLLFRTRLPNIISLAASRNPNSLRMLVDQCSITLRQLCALILHASANGQQGVESVLDHIVRQHMQGVPRVFEAWTSMASRAQLRQFILNLSVPDSILQPYIVRRVDAVTSPVVESSNPDRPAEEPMEVEEQEASGSSNGSPSSIIDLQNDPEPLPPVDLGSESWHDQVPAEWVPIIVRDSNRQRRQIPQPTFSDAYLSGMPSKRRKIVTNAKPQGSLPQVIQDSVRRAVTASGLAAVAPLETVSQAAAADINIQSAYRELLRTSVQSTLQDNEDFTPERYPNASNYFSKPQ
ncbi:hypothetical protein AMK59_3956 [Oryctes borbonicus]|uniref:Large proline-rich protein BAG6 domain-containing protein n=1 Tax=Oryctes borbonicus TaxID=1629725 RepID=A0A0T6B8E4_9SCAR|nr:hypothetical protein AMK59_3956 [Oryctes borbonicus]